MSKNVGAKVITFEKKDFLELYRIMNSIKDISSNLNIVNGMVRQRSDSREIFFEVDLTSLFSNVELLPISRLKMKLDLLKTFLGGSQNIIVRVDNDNGLYSFEDNVSRYIFRWSDITTAAGVDSENRFISNEEYEAIVGRFDNQVGKFTLDKLICERIKSVSQLFGSRTIKLEFGKDGKMRISLKSQNKDQNVIFVENLDSSLVDVETTMTVKPFTIDFESPSVTMTIFHETGGSKLLEVIEGVIAGTNTPITFWAASIINEED